MQYCSLVLLVAMISKPARLKHKPYPTCMVASLLVWMLLFSSSAFAYLGPGAGLGMLGSLIAIAVVMLVVVLGLIVYPLRMLKKRRMQAKLKNGDGVALNP